MRLPSLDLRLRIAIALATVCIAVVGALGFTLYTASEDMEEALVQQLVTEELESLIERARHTGHAPASGPNIQYYVFKTPEQLDMLPPALRTLAPGHHEVGSGENEKHVAVRDLGGTRYIVVYDAGPHELREWRFRQLLYSALGTIALLSVAIGYWLAGVLTRQLTDLAASVATLHPDTPHPPLERSDHDREVAAVARALDDYHARIVEMIRREQEFTSNASHELRTPLTAIRTSCELLLGESGVPQKARTRIEQVDRAARQMTERIEVLLLLARSHRREAVETVALRRCVEDAAYPYLDEIEQKGLQFDIAIPESQLVQVDRKALQLVLSNLIKNAVRYTDRGHVRVSYEAPRVIVSDSGSGIAPEHQPQLFERYFRADNRPEGLGLGLAIVRRICDHFGWKIEVKSAPGSGSAFSVLLS
ncbi:MAG TPA: HAMP domain-containing sensor histidine kinase [Burkholderiales bacterium]|nr:HAMP domain-containing sensor histidine kinase [Burkholderiales bacterium]